MGSSYFGEPNMGGSDRGSGGSSSSSSSRKGKKNNQDKPKQPQRGLGVAQLEKIRLHGQMACTYHPPLHTTPYPSNFTNEDPRVQAPYSQLPSSSSFSYSSSSTSYSSSYGFQPNTVMGLPEYERSNIRYGDSQPSNTATRWEHGNTIMEPHHNITRPFLNLYESPNIDTMMQRSGSSSQNSESSDNQEPDLELRLSL